MSYRASAINSLLGGIIALGRSMGLMIKVETSDHSIDVSLERPSKDNRAWDLNLYRNGNLFVHGYSNPIKPRVRHNIDLEDPDTVDHVAGNPDSTDSDSDDSEQPHVHLISSSRYRDYMRQDLISQMLTPQSRWDIMLYAMIGLGGLVFFQMLLTMYVNGAFA